MIAVSARRPLLVGTPLVLAALLALLALLMLVLWLGAQLAPAEPSQLLAPFRWEPHGVPTA